MDASNQTVSVLYAPDQSDLGRAITTRLQESGYLVTFFDDNANVGRRTAGISGAFRRSDFFVPVVSDQLLRDARMACSFEMALAYAGEEGRPRVIAAVVTEGIVPSLLDRLVYLRADPRALDIAGIASQVLMSVNLAAGQEAAKTEGRVEFQTRVERQLENDIDPILTALSKREIGLRNGAVFFYAIAMVALVAGLGFALVRAHEAHEAAFHSWFDLAQYGVVGAIVIGMLSAVARLSYILGRSFMIESLTNGDRAHAISFGRFYLKAFGDKATWDELKEAFKDWNIDRGASFLAQSASDADPIILQAVVEAAKALAGKKKDKSE